MKKNNTLTIELGTDVALFLKWSIEDELEEMREDVKNPMPTGIEWRESLLEALKKARD